MKKWRWAVAILLAVLLMLPSAVFAAEDAGGAPDYGSMESWAYFALGEDTGVDVFLVCPTVDTRSETNSFDLNEKLKAKFVNALDMEMGIYAEAGRLFSPYYRQMSMNAYKLSEDARAQAQEIAYSDVSAAFRWYLDNANGGRGLILAGFSQGSQMCLELLKEYFDSEDTEAQALGEQLIAVYAIGWSVTEDMTAAYPQIVPAFGETDTGVVISFDCEDGSLTDTLVIPAGTKALSINPLNWKTDGTMADKTMNLGAVMSTGAEPIPALCGAWIGARGELVVTDVTAEAYPAVIDIFPDGAYHIYDYMFFFENLRENVAVRTNAWRTGLPFKDVADGAWYEDAAKYVYEQGLMTGTGEAMFSPGLALTRAQLVTILWRCAGEPTVDGGASFGDVDPGAWYADAVRWATKEQIVARVGSFGPDDILSREETVVLMWNYAKYTGADVSVGEDTNILSYDDAFDITEGFAPAMQWAVGSGLITGTDDAHLSPQGRLTRAQTAMILKRLPDALRAGQPIAEKTGIIGAMDVEVASLKSAMEITDTKTIAGMEFCEGTLDGKAVVVVQCGMGKVNAGICAHTLINEFGVSRVINTGVAGSLDNAIDIGDIVVSTDAVQHDYDVSPIGFARGEIPYTGLYAFPASETLRAIAVEAAHAVAPDIGVFEGRVCSGDQFIASKEQKEAIISAFGGKCCEMEGGAIAQACYLNDTPFVIIRAISDKADESEEVSFQEFEAAAAERCAAIVRYMIANS